MSCMGAAVDFITTDGPAGHAGFTASAVCSVTDTPPTLLVCLNRGASVWPVFNENRTLCVNTLERRAGAAFKSFWRQNTMEHRFAAARWQTGVTGSPQLEEALVSFDCVSPGGERRHPRLLFCAIEAIHRHTTPYGLVSFDRSYHALMHLLVNLLKETADGNVRFSSLAVESTSQRAAWSRRMNDCRLLDGSNGRSTRGGDVWRDGVNADSDGAGSQSFHFNVGDRHVTVFLLLPAGASPVISAPARLLSAS